MMSSSLTLFIALMVLACLVSIPLLVFSLECLLSMFSDRDGEASDSVDRSDDVEIPDPSLVVMIPAHDEETEIGETVRSISSQLRPGDRIVVVADNCTDNTAAYARRAGAEVFVRSDTSRRGKSFAQRYGLKRLIAEGRPELLLLYDSDVTLEPATIERLRRKAVTTERPIQGRYLILPPADSTPRDQISALAVLFRNHVRPLGLRRLGGPCLLFGQGIALRGHLLDPDLFDTDQLAEDFHIGIRLIERGWGPLYYEHSRANSFLPRPQLVARNQRMRWEHGNLNLLLRDAPRLLYRGLRQRRWSLIGAALDLLVPPLTLMVVLSVLALAFFGLIVLVGGPIWPFGVVAGVEAFTLVAFLLAWWRHGRQIVPAGTLLQIPLYMLWKVPIYARYLTNRQPTWDRTPRDVPIQQSDRPDGPTSRASCSKGCSDLDDSDISPSAAHFSTPAHARHDAPS